MLVKQQTISSDTDMGSTQGKVPCRTPVLQETNKIIFYLQKSQNPETAVLEKVIKGAELSVKNEKPSLVLVG